MTGHEPILAMRRAGKAPASVLVTDDARERLNGATVYIAPDDTPELLDLRFLVGLTAVVDGFDGAWVDRICRACSAHARRVIGCTFNHWSRIERMTDTQGVMVWPD